MNIVVIGSLAFDDISTDHGTVTDTPGGSALYFSTAASFFAPVSLVGIIGDDFPGEELQFLEQRGVNTDCLEIIKGGKTFRWGCAYKTDMNKRSTTNLELNVFKDFNPVLNERCRKAEYVFLGNIDPDIQLNVISQIESAKFVGADTIECYIKDKPEVLKKVLQKVNFLVINDEEARLITGEYNLINAAKALLKLGPEYVVVKKGEHGSVLAAENELFVIPAYPLSAVIDPTGAGDSYAGGAMGYIAKMNSTDFQTIKSAVVYGGIVASFAVEKFGLNRLKNLSMAELEERYAIFRSITLF